MHIFVYFSYKYKKIYLGTYLQVYLNIQERILILKDFLQKFAFVCMLSFDVYVKKQVIEKIVDGMAEANKKDKK